MKKRDIDKSRKNGASRRDVLKGAASVSIAALGSASGLAAMTEKARAASDLRAQLGLIPGVGALSMLALFIGSCINFASPDQSKTSFAGVGAALIFGAGGMLIGVVLMLWMRVILPAFFRRTSEVADPAVAAQS